MEELSLDNILTEDQISGLFSEEDVQEPSKEIDGTTEPNKPEDKEETTEVDPDELFGGPESVGSEDGKEGKEDTNPAEGNTSPNFYSSIANALVVDGIFQNLDNEKLSNIKTAEDFAEIISDQIKSQFDERQKRIDEALSYGVEPSEIQRYESYLHTLDSITEDAITAEDERGENLRKNIIYQNYINRGVSKERAMKYVDRSFKAGTDIEDAKDALQDNKEFFNKEYNRVISEAKDIEAKEREEYKKRAEELKSSILNNDKVFGDIELDKVTRQRVYDSIVKPVYTDPETGEKLTAIQKYESENKIEFMKNLGLIFTLTDGFKNLDNLVKGKVKKEMKKGIRELEQTISNTSRNSDGSLSFASGVSDPNSKITKWDLDI